MLMCIKAFSYFTLNHQPLTSAEQTNRKDVSWALGDISFAQRTHRTGAGKEDVT